MRRNVSIIETEYQNIIFASTVANKVIGKSLNSDEYNSGQTNVVKATGQIDVISVELKAT